MSDQAKHLGDAVEDTSAWYVAAMNDCIFIIDRQPHPAPLDHVNPNAPAPNVIISMRSGSLEVENIAGQIVKAHNAAIARFQQYAADLEHDLNESVRQCNEDHGS